MYNEEHPLFSHRVLNRAKPLYYYFSSREIPKQYDCLRDDYFQRLLFLDWLLFTHKSFCNAPTFREVKERLRFLVLKNSESECQKDRTYQGNVTVDITKYLRELVAHLSHYNQSNSKPTSERARMRDYAECVMND